jgi:hypothetical protein
MENKFQSEITYSIELPQHLVYILNIIVETTSWDHVDKDNVSIAGTLHYVC